MEFTIPIVADWQITNQCNRSCSFCYGPMPSSELNLEEGLLALSNLQKLGTRIIGITGGEPLLRKDIFDIIHKAKQIGFGICLSSNADHYRNNRINILENVDCLGLPLEGGTERSHDFIRGEGSFNAIMDALKDTYNNSNMRYRIGTVIYPGCESKIEEIAKVLEPYAEKIVYWKLYEYIDYPGRAMNKLPTGIDNDKLQDNIDRCRSMFIHSKIIYDTLNQRNRSYFLIKPNGDVFVPNLNSNERNEFIIGNLLGDLNMLRNQWSNAINKDSYNLSYRCVFRQDPVLRGAYLDSKLSSCECVC